MNQDVREKQKLCRTNHVFTGKKKKKKIRGTDYYFEEKVVTKIERVVISVHEEWRSINIIYY